jgi:hypothetical protein
MYKVLELFCGQHHHVRLAGFTVRVKGNPVHIIAKLSVLFGDEPALKEMISCKGHAGLRPCLLCMNVVLHRALATVRNSVSIASTDWSAFKLHTDETIRAVVRRLTQLHGQMLANELSKGNFGDKQIALGFNFTPVDIICNKSFDLQVASSVMWDWAHEYVHNGLADDELGACMKALSRQAHLM